MHSRFKHKLNTILVAALVLLYFSFFSLDGFCQNETGDQTEKNSANNYQYSFGLTAGLQSPYGIGGEFSYMLGKNMDANIGIGFGFEGLKMGLGARLFFGDAEFSPYLGFNLIQSTGSENVNIANRLPVAVFNIRSDQALHIKGGLKWNLFYNQNLYFTGGYAFARNGYEAQFVSGFYHEQNQNAANLFAIGGYQISLTYTLGFERIKQTPWKGDSWGK